MRKITKAAINAFMNAQAYKSSNTEVKILPNVTVLILHDNEIAYKYNDPAQTLSITNAGWKSNVTKERLNALPGVRIQQKKGVWYLNGNEWNGKLTDISYKTKVKFYKEFESVLAVFPELNEGNGYRTDLKLCYSHNGQHSTAAIEYTKKLKKAKPSEYKELANELTKIGYYLEIV